MVLPKLTVAVDLQDPWDRMQSWSKTKTPHAEDWGRRLAERAYAVFRRNGSETEWKASDRMKGQRCRHRRDQSHRCHPRRRPLLIQGLGWPRRC